jgi:hypothetical protein
VKRSELKRRTPLVAKAPLSAGKELRRTGWSVSERTRSTRHRAQGLPKARNTGPSAAVRRLVHARSDNPRDWENRRKVYGPYEGDHQQSFTACAALADAIDSGAFEDVLLEAFGDHARVTVRAAGITVDTYEHD